jgi:two-component system sensor histidine kinase KdpD
VAVENLRTDALPDDERRTQAQLALDEVVRLGRLLRNILDMARIEARAVSVEQEWVTPSDVIDAALSILRPVLDQHEVRIDAEVSSVVFVDPRLTSGALAQVLDNAAHYSPAGTSIDLCGSVESDGLRLSVRDHGPGLDPSEIDRIFERFFRGRAKVGRVLGTGLGLAIAQGLVAAQGGRVRGENAPGGGARFIVSMPARSRPTLPAED